jgi:hypothetical protein
LNPQKAQDIGKSARQRTEECYSIEIIAEEFLDLWTEVGKGRWAHSFSKMTYRSFVQEMRRKSIGLT